MTKVSVQLIPKKDELNLKTFNRRNKQCRGKNIRRKNRFIWLSKNDVIAGFLNGKTIKQLSNHYKVSKAVVKNVINYTII